MNILIKGGRIIDPSQGLDFIGDLLCIDGKIAKISESIDTSSFNPDDTEIIDASGLWVTPGFIDMHVHLREPGYTHKETIATGSNAAIRGGFTTVCCMPNTKPVADNASTILYIVNVAKSSNTANVLPIGSITKGQCGKILSDIEEMVNAGAVAISEDGKSVESPKLMKEAMKIAASLNIPVLSHCEDIELVDHGVMNESSRAKKLGLLGISADSEETMIARDIILARSTGARLHICHISTAGGVQLVREAKARNEAVTAEVCPHHFILTDEDVDGIDGNYKMNPPLRTKKDVNAIIEGLKDGTIDVIATDHAPHHEDEKEGGFNEAANGIVGLETAFHLAYTELVTKGHISENELLKKLTINPAKALGIDKGTLKEGSDCDVVIIDPKSECIIDVGEFQSMGRNSPFDGWRVNGLVLYTIVNGNIVFHETHFNVNHFEGGAYEHRSTNR